nr:MAG TPA: hypothetical protein [Caudoviricetes sp.]
MSSAARACGPWQTNITVHSPRCARGQLMRSGRSRGTTTEPRWNKNIWICVWSGK